MNCRDLHRYIGLYLDSELDSAVAADIAEHARTCAPCGARLQAEEALERRIQLALRKPLPEDDAAWNNALAALPRTRRVRAAGLGALAAAVALVATLFWRETGQAPLDLATTLAEHYTEYTAGRSPLGVETSDPAAAAAYLRGKLDLEGLSMASPPPGTILLGARLCYLDGVVTAFFVLHHDRRPIIVAVFAADDLDHFPEAFAASAATGAAHCRVGPLSFVVERHPAQAVCVVGEPSLELLSTIAHLFRPE